MSKALWPLSKASALTETKKRNSAFACHVNAAGFHMEYSFSLLMS